ncbi:DUF2520 domain-containing protein [Flaviflexus salsibiostraticola]|uniref:DUF2520 domain-containing protein n=1 Tax=Flaviflexus salsibiostraticola TaxID=1282737 RepID=A0A3Q8WTL8_9ACTO|nr:DUF2520 domain-containing protein [Flaviflexus salsibiostraticola]AZN30029.1 DUF2520 domain-containing protein [Flaviflexus salsibiostraticola]
MKLGVGIISTGRVGAVLGAALGRAGHTIVAAHARSEESIERAEVLLPGVPLQDVEEIVRTCELVLLALPDRELPGLVEGLAKAGAWQPGHLVVHTAGSMGVEVLAPAAAMGALGLAIHPAMTFTGTSLDLSRLVDCPFAVSGPATILPVAQALVTEIEGIPFEVPSERRALYHAALAHGGNHVVTVVTQAMRMLEEAGIDDPGAFLGPLVGASVDGALRSREALLTGPVVRGDVPTIEKHVDVLSEYPDVLSTYRAIASATADRAVLRSTITEATAADIKTALED